MRLINAQEGTLARLWDCGVHFHSLVPLHRGKQRASRDTAAWKTLQAGRSVSETSAVWALCALQGSRAVWIDVLVPCKLGRGAFYPA